MGEQADPAVELLLRRIREKILREAVSSCCPGEDSSTPIEVDSLETLLAYLRKCKAVMITFYTPTCPYCRAFRGIYAEAARLYGRRLPFLRVNAWRLPEAAEMFGVMGVPMTVAIAHGRPVGVLYGLVDLERVEELSKKAIEAGGCPEP